MKRYGFLLCILFALLAASYFLAVGCGGSSQDDESGGYYLTGDDETDDDETDEDPNGCKEAVDTIYDCGHYFIRDDVQQSEQDAYIECLALSSSNDAWICRLNCAKGITDCDLLLECLQMCPTL